MTRPNPSDLALLQAWSTDRDRHAAGELIHRHINFVHAQARRRVGGDEHLADDITQAVFILLLRKAHQIRNEAAMTSWLYTTTRYAAANATKMLRRRSHHEQQSISYISPAPPLQPDTAAESADMQPILHDAIDQLTKTDRLCVIMSFLQQKSHDEVAAAMGLSPHAARKRISRAVERMREYLSSRGITASVLTLGATLGAKHVPVAASLIESTLNVAILSHSTEAISTSATIAKAVTNMMLTMKLKIAAALVLSLMLTGLVAARAVRLLTPAQPPSAPQTTEAAIPAEGSVADLGGGILVEFVGVSPLNTDLWTDLNGFPIDAPKGINKPRIGIRPPPTHRALVRVTAPDDVDLGLNASGTGAFGSNISPGAPGQKNYQLFFTPKPGATSVSLDVSVADGPWKNSGFEANMQGNGIMSIGMAGIGMTITPMIEQNGKTLVFISTSGIPGLHRLAAVGLDKKVTVGKSQGSAGTANFNTEGYLFDLPPLLIRGLQLQTRIYNKHVTARELALDADHPTAAKIVIDRK